jgi:hypothetical protein
MSKPECGKNEAERWFERYLRDHGYEYDYEPDFGVSTHPDFLVQRADVQFVCEVKGFDQPTPLEKRLRGSSQTMAISSDEEYGPMRSAVREAARQLKPLAGSEYPLVAVLANPKGYRVNLTLERLVEAMFGNPGFVGNFNAEKGEVEGGFRFEYGRDGRLRNDHPYISAVAILRERSRADKYYNEWRTKWKQTRKPLEHPTTDEIIAEAMAEQAAWKVSDESRHVPEGNFYVIEVMTTGSPDAVPLPENVFDCSADKRVEVQRVAEQLEKSTEGTDRSA